MTRALWLIEAADATGYPVVVVDAWETRGNSDGFDPHVVVEHHTAGPSTGDMPSLGIVTNGRADLPGPLSNYGLGRSGTIYVVASGKSNNAGVGFWQGYDSNYDTIGIEAENDGKQPWPAAQVDAYDRLAAECLRRMGEPAALVCAHREWAQPPGRKVDPHSFNMTDRRAASAAFLNEGTPGMFTPDEIAALHEVVGAELAAILATNDDNTSQVSRTVAQHGGAFSGAADPADNWQRTAIRTEQAVNRVEDAVGRIEEIVTPPA